MRDIKQVRGKKQYVNNIDEATKLVRQKYAGAFKQGSIGAYHWYQEEEKNVVAEAWIHRKSGWWLRIKE